MAYIGQTPLSGDFRKLDNISSQFNDSNTTFVLQVSGSSVVPGNQQALLISLNGVLQEPGAAFTISGSDIIFSTPPNTGSTFFGVLLGSVGQAAVPADGTVTTAKLAANAVTESKIASNAVTESKIASNAVTNDKINNGAVTSQKLSGNIQLVGTTTFLGGAIEKANVVAGSVTSNVSINNIEESIVYYTGATAANTAVTVDFKNLSGVSVGNVASYVVIITNNTTNNAFINTVLVDGASANVLRFIEGVPTNGSANIDSYTFSVIKTAVSTYTVLGSKSEFRS